MRIDQYPLGNRTIQTATDMLFGIVAGQAADIPISQFLGLVPGSAFQGGPTLARPAIPILYQMYFDTTLGLPIWCKQVSPAIWVNAAGITS